MIDDNKDVREVELNVRITLIHGGQQGGRGICERVEHLDTAQDSMGEVLIFLDGIAVVAKGTGDQVERMEWKQVQRVEDGDRAPEAGRI